MHHFNIKYEDISFTVETVGHFLAAFICLFFKLFIRKRHETSKEMQFMSLKMICNLFIFYKVVYFTLKVSFNWSSNFQKVAHLSYSQEGVQNCLLFWGHLSKQEVAEEEFKKRKEVKSKIVFLANNCPAAAWTKGRVFAPHGPRSAALLTLFTVLYTRPFWCSVSVPVCCVWVSDSLSGGQRMVRSDQTHPRFDIHNTKPKHTGGTWRLLDRVSAPTGLFSDSLHCNTFPNMPTTQLSQVLRLLFDGVTIPWQYSLICNTISTI